MNILNEDKVGVLTTRRRAAASSALSIAFSDASPAAVLDGIGQEDRCARRRRAERLCAAADHRIKRTGSEPAVGGGGVGVSVGGWLRVGHARAPKRARSNGGRRGSSNAGIRDRGQAGAWANGLGVGERARLRRSISKRQDDQRPPAVFGYADGMFAIGSSSHIPSQARAARASHRACPQTS
jgi:hypothetical protein